MRQSVAPNRVFQASGTVSSAAALTKLLEKKKEFDAVSALERASTLYLERIEALGEDSIVMADAGEVHGRVLEQWPRMFQILGQFSSRQQLEADNETASQVTTNSGQRLVRIPIEELQKAAKSG